MMKSAIQKTPYTLGPKISDWDEQRSEWLRNNPDFPNFIRPNKPRVLVTGSSPKLCENPVGDHYLLKSIKNKIDYCRLHGIEIFYNMAFLDAEMAGFWTKLPLIRKLLLSHPEIEFLWWMNSDATITAMVYLLATGKEQWGGKVYFENHYYLHGYWGTLVHCYEEMIENYHPGFGDHRWLLVTHFVGSKPREKFGDYPVERCLKQMDRAYNFRDNQILTNDGHYVQSVFTCTATKSLSSMPRVENKPHHSVTMSETANQCERNIYSQLPPKQE